MYRGISHYSYSNILIPRGFSVEFALQKPLNYFAIGAREDLETRKSTMFGDTIYPRIKHVLFVLPTP